MTAIDDAWAAWRAARPETDLLHLDSAAVGRAATTTLDAAAAHARAESVEGGYVAQQRAGAEVDGLRRDLGTVLGTDADGIALTESAMTALEALVRAWPLAAGARVAVPDAEWGPNVDVLEAAGASVTGLPVDGAGVVDLDALERLLGDDPPEVVLVDHVAAHRGLVQPVAEVLEVAQRYGVPVWVDAAQSAGHVVVPPGADAVVATSRKWLAGPRGVGMLAVAEAHRDRLRVRRPAKLADAPAVHLLDSDEAHVAGRVGLASAVRDHLALGREAVEQRLREVGAAVRELATTLPGWEVVRPDAPAAATTALRPTAGQDVAAARQWLLDERRVLTSVCLPWRAPREPGAGPWLRVSPHVDLTEADLERLGRALTEVNNR